MTTHIGTVTPFEFEDHLILGMDGKMKDMFGNLTFDVSIINGRLVIKSSQRIQK